MANELLCVFSGQVQKQDGEHTITVPDTEISVGELETGGVYRIAIWPQAQPPGQAASSPSEDPERPVSAGEVIDVEIEDLGAQGDGVAKIGPGFVVIVPETRRGDQVTVKVTEVRDTMAFAEAIDNHSRV